MSLQCRICLEDDIIENLCSPCKCNGTSKYIHPHCLTTWRNENINTPFYNTCIDCRTKYKYSIATKEKLFLNNKNTLYIYIFFIGLIALLLSIFDNESSFKIFNSIKNKNMSYNFNQTDNNYYYIFYYLILANYLVNCSFFITSYILLFKIVNTKQYLSQMCCSKLYNVVKLNYIIILYLILSIKTFLSFCFLLVFVDCASVNLYIDQHNKILNDINIDNVMYYVETENSENNTIRDTEEQPDTEELSDNIIDFDDNYIVGLIN